MRILHICFITNPVYQIDVSVVYRRVCKYMQMMKNTFNLLCLHVPCALFCMYISTRGTTVYLYA